MDWQPFYISLKLALVTTIVLMVIAAPLAYWLSTTNFRGRAAIEAIVALPIVLPPTVLGFFVLVALGNHSPIGQFFTSVFGSTLAFTFTGLVIASVLYSLPFAVQPMQNSFESINKGLFDAARTLGLTKWQCFLKVALPASKRGLLCGAMLAFAHTVGEFGVVLMVGGSIPGETKVASIAIYENVEMLDFHSAAAMSAVLLVFSFAVLSIVYYLGRKNAQFALR
ncbi:MAG: molybdate ABC transporter permease subunit [Deltaproteobacteria bacterium]|nr:molybdate ABC transporter permease subunit [Deltaproteobacteria bacterium]